MRVVCEKLMPPLPFPGELFQENERKLQIVFKKIKFKGHNSVKYCSILPKTERTLLWQI